MRACFQARSISRRKEDRKILECGWDRPKIQCSFPTSVLLRKRTGLSRRRRVSSSKKISDDGQANESARRTFGNLSLILSQQFDRTQDQNWDQSWSDLGRNISILRSVHS